MAFIRWKRRERVGNHGEESYWYAPGGALMVAYLAQSFRIGGKPRQRATYLASIRSGHLIEEFDSRLAEILSDMRGERKSDVRRKVMFHHAIRRLYFWRDVVRGFGGDPDKIKYKDLELFWRLRDTVARITKDDADLITDECRGWTDGYPKLLQEIGFGPDRVAHIWNDTQLERVLKKKGERPSARSPIAPRRKGKIARSASE